jgi:cytochrome P450
MQWGLELTAPSSLTGVICIINIFGVHHNPAVWPDPEVLSPLVLVHHRWQESALPLPQHRHTCLSLAVLETPPSSLVSSPAGL